MGIMRKNQGSTQAIAGTLQRNLSGEELLRGDGKIRSIQLPSIRYFAYFITRKHARALRRDRKRPTTSSTSPSVRSPIHVRYRAKSHVTPLTIAMPLHIATR
jgi:hypothetical protein